MLQVSIPNEMCNRMPLDFFLVVVSSNTGTMHGRAVVHANVIRILIILSYRIPQFWPTWIPKPLNRSAQNLKRFDLSAGFQNVLKLIAIDQIVNYYVRVTFLASSLSGLLACAQFLSSWPRSKYITLHISLRIETAAEVSCSDSAWPNWIRC